MTETSPSLGDTTALLAAGITPLRDPRRWQPPTASELVGVFPNLEIISLLGAGGMGAVYKARQTHLDRIVALKLLSSSRSQEPGFDERFMREARTLARLEHPSIVSIHDYGRVQDRSYLVMQHIEGSNLRQVMATGALSGAEVLRLVPQLCDALTHAHAAGVVHRDLKPENILIDGKGNAHIADFGLAKLHHSDEALTGTGEVLGTAHYMAPEQLAAAASVDHRADLYALGVIIYEMLTGSLPLGRFEMPSRSSDIAPAVDEVVMRSLERDPARRFPSAGAFSQAMEQAGRASTAPAAGAATRIDPPVGAPAAKANTVHMDTSGIHIVDGKDEVHIGLTGIQVRSSNGDSVQVGNPQTGSPTGPASPRPSPGTSNTSVHSGGSGAGDFFSSGMLAIFGGAAYGGSLALARLGDFLAAPSAHFAQHGAEDLAMLATPVIIAGGVALLARCYLPMVILGVAAEMLLVPCMWKEHPWLFWLTFLVPVIFQLQCVFRFQRLEAHMDSLPTRVRLVRWMCLLPVMLGALVVPVLPWLHPGVVGWAHR